MSSNNKTEWATWSFISQKIKEEDLTLVVWGKSEDWLPKVLRKQRPELIVDSNKSLNGEQYEGIPIVSPDKIDIKDWKKYYVVICTSAFAAVSNELTGYGLAQNVNFSVIPDLKDIQLVDDVASFECEFLATSSDHDGVETQRGSSLGGGIYYCKLDSNGLFLKRKFQDNIERLNFIKISFMQ